MPELHEGLSLAIDTASDVAGIALFEHGTLLAETTWYAHQSHSRQLLPAVDWLLGHVGRGKGDLRSLVVCLGPGSYAGMRVGLSTAKTLAYALDLPLVGIGRLAADALPVAEASRCRVIAIQVAGRAELAYAAYHLKLRDLSRSVVPGSRNVAPGSRGVVSTTYRMTGDEFVEELAPGLGKAQVIVDALGQGDIVCGEVERLDEAVVAAIEAKGARLLVSMAPRAVSLGRLGLQRLARGEIDNPDTLVPLYLRAPAIGPQPPS